MAAVTGEARLVPAEHVPSGGDVVVGLLVGIDVRDVDVEAGVGIGDGGEGRCRGAPCRPSASGRSAWGRTRCSRCWSRPSSPPGPQTFSAQPRELVVDFASRSATDREHLRDVRGETRALLVVGVVGRGGEAVIAHGGEDGDARVDVVLGLGDRVGLQHAAVLRAARFHRAPAVADELRAHGDGGVLGEIELVFRLAGRRAVLLAFEEQDLAVRGTRR